MLRLALKPQRKLRRHSEAESSGQGSAAVDAPPRSTGGGMDRCEFGGQRLQVGEQISGQTKAPDTGAGAQGRNSLWVTSSGS
ncbi:hypothetical protein GCM10012275_63910 [Longimycelium tulufanense]|uniref:Uncharacterized protein n=1 Tax=Longimycelium tulufanense TaxID=907463 RepID=A0A8J3CJ63_9PSEU|nr:hypothetical protein GCM10012275_63910 [Longimycelium tulufanense]